MKVVSVIQKKGGAGKTTVAMNLAMGIQELRPRLKVAVADADAEQHSSLNWIGRGDHDLRVVAVAEDRDGKRLKAEIDSLDADIVIIDCPPAVEAVAMRAALHANLVLIPISPCFLDYDAAKDGVELCKEVAIREGRSKSLILPIKIRKGTKSSKDLLDNISKMGAVAKSTLGLRQAFPDSAAAGIGAGAFAPGSAAHKEVLDLAAEVLNHLGMRGKNAKG